MSPHFLLLMHIVCTESERITLCKLQRKKLAGLAKMVTWKGKMKERWESSLTDVYIFTD